MSDENVNNLQTDSGVSAVRIFFNSIAELNPITSAMAKAYNQHMDEKRWKYVEKFFSDVRENMQTHEDKLDELYDRTNPEENLNLMLMAIDKVEYEYQEERRKKYAELFVNSILVGNQIIFDEKRMFIQLFSELSEADIILLGKFSLDGKIHLETFRTPASSEDLEKVIPLVSRLESRGLITEVYDALNMTRWEGSPKSTDSKWRNRVYSLTSIGNRFCMFLKVS